LTYDEAIKELPLIHPTNYYVAVIECPIAPRDDKILNAIFGETAINYIKDNYRKVKVVGVGPRAENIALGDELWGSKNPCIECLLYREINIWMYLDKKLIKTEELPYVMVGAHLHIVEKDFLERIDIILASIKT